jgi:GNAT superfamily N-acetyltransferase
LPVEIARVGPEAVAPLYAATQREALKTLYGFSVIWHEQTHDFAAYDAGTASGAATIRIAASLAHVERIVVLPEYRRRGIGRTLLDSAADVANYYNCHKMTVLVPHGSAAQTFFEACGYREEAVLAQHTFKLDVAVLRKFLL